MRLPVIAILDIGKTNKKCLLFNEQYEVVFESALSIKETVDEDGDACEDIAALSLWAVNMIKEIITDPDFEVKAINFSAYGASFVYIDEKGKLLTPLYNYLKAYPEQLQLNFDAQYNQDGKFYIQTASPKLGSLNSGLQVFRLQQEQPVLFEKVKVAMHLPQFISHLFTNQVSTDITSIGCHTGLWDYTKQTYHDWVKASGILHKLAPIIAPNNTTKVNIDHHDLQVGIGLHDSSAALIPYLKYFQDPFVLISTGTWCISLNPFNDTPLTHQQLENDCLCYMGYTGKPVKAARLFAGYEHEQVIIKLANHFNKPLDYYKTILFDFNLINQSSLSDLDAVTPVGVNPSSFSKKDLKNYTHYEAAYHDFILDIIKQQYFSTSLILNKEIKTIFVDGGFSNNSIYMSLLAYVFPTLQIFAALLPQSSSRGAAMVIHDAWNTKALPTSLISLKAYQAIKS